MEIKSNPLKRASMISNWFCIWLYFQFSTNDGKKKFNIKTKDVELWYYLFVMLLQFQSHFVQLRCIASKIEFPLHCLSCIFFILVCIQHQQHTIVNAFVINVPFFTFNFLGIFFFSHIHSFSILLSFGRCVPKAKTYICFVMYGQSVCMFRSSAMSGETLKWNATITLRK